MRSSPYAALFLSTRATRVSLLLIAVVLVGALDCWVGATSAQANVTVCPAGCTYSTIDSALDATATTGDTIKVMAGTYRFKQKISTSGKHASPSAPTVLKAIGSVVIDCSDSFKDSSWTQHSGNIYRASRAPTLMNPPVTQVHVDDVRYTFDSDTGYTSVSQQHWKYDPVAGTVYVNVGGIHPNPADHATYIGDKNRSVGIELDNCDYIVVDGFTVLRAAGKGIFMQGSEPGRALSNIVQNDTTAECWAQGIEFLSTRRGLITHNLSHDNGSHGIHVAVSDTCGVTWNTSYGNDDPLLVRGGKAGIKIGDSATDTSRTVVNCWVDYNVVHDNEDTGIDLLGARLIAVRRNVTYRNRDHGFDNNTTAYTAFINNTAFGNEHDGMSIENTSSNVSIYNCIFAYDAHNAATLASPTEGVWELEVNGAAGFTSDNNVFIGWGPGLADTAGTGGERHLILYGGTPYDALNTGYQTASGQDHASYQSFPAFADTGLAAYDFTIADNASAVTDNVVDAANANISGWLSPMWLSADPHGIAPHQAKKADAGSGTPSYMDIGAFEYDPRPQPTVDFLLDSCEPDSQTIGWYRVKWTAVYGDSAFVVGDPAAGYEIRGRTAPITEANWDSSGVGNFGGPGQYTFGAALSWYVQASQVEYFRLKSKDANGHWSGLSTQIMINPDSAGAACHDIWYGGGGGGGGEGGGGCSRFCDGGLVAHAPTLTSLRRPGGGVDAVGVGENTILNAAPTGSAGTDLLPIEAWQNAAGQYLAHLRVTRGHGILVDGVRLLLVDHPEGTEAFAYGSTVVSGSRSQASHAVTETGADVTDLLNGTGGIFNAAEAEAVTVSTPLDSRQTPLVIECANGGMRGHAIIVESQSPSGWQQVGIVYPRRVPSACVIDSVPAGPVRLRFTGYAYVSSVARLDRVTAQVANTWERPLGAVSASAGNVLAAIGAEDTVATALVGPDTLWAVFSAPLLGQGVVRNAFLGVSATQVTASAALNAAAQRVSSLPTEFALYQNVPNPFRGSTTFRLDLPVGRMVRLEIFDVSGRRVRTLVNHFMPAGRQSVAWNQRDDSGAELGAGVYFARVQADTFRDRKKLVLMP